MNQNGSILAWDSGSNVGAEIWEISIRGRFSFVLKQDVDMPMACWSDVFREAAKVRTVMVSFAVPVRRPPQR